MKENVYKYSWYQNMAFFNYPVTKTKAQRLIVELFNC